MVKRVSKLASKPVLTRKLKKGAKSKPAPKRVARNSKVKDTRSFPLMDPRNPLPVPSHFPCGSALDVRSTARFDFTVPAGSTALVFFTNTPLCQFNAMYVIFTNSAVVPVPVYVAMPQLQSAGATAIKPSKGGMVCSNITKALDIAGYVTLLMSESRWKLPTSATLMDGLQWTTVLGALRANTRSQNLTAHQMVEPRHAVLGVTDWSDYADFKSPTAADFALGTTLDRVIFEAPFALGIEHLDRSMQIASLGVAASSVDQVYSFTLRTTHMCRFPQDTILSSMQKPVPVRSPATRMPGSSGQIWLTS
jgi:hypothetical protein